jgi:DNA polymerase III gamma/tau subunit
MFAGNEEIKQSLIEMLKRDDPPKSFLLVGPSGCGKTTLGRIIAKGLGCVKGDFKELNTASDRTLPAIRKILDEMRYAPMDGKKKVILFDEAHQLLSATQEALLKALEEPPKHVHFVICTTNPEALKDTFKRRCHIYEVSLLTSSTLIAHMRKILTAEKVKDFPVPVLDKIVELSGGSPGIALKYLDMVIDMPDDVDRALGTLKSAGTSESEVIEICRALVNMNISDMSRWVRVKRLLLAFSGDGESARRPILAYLSKCLLNTEEGFEIAMMMDEFKDNFYDSGKPGLYLACFKSCFLKD